MIPCVISYFVDIHSLKYLQSGRCSFLDNRYVLTGAGTESHSRNSAFSNDFHGE